jgi:hypothetical protein
MNCRSRSCAPRLSRSGFTVVLLVGATYVPWAHAADPLDRSGVVVQGDFDGDRESDTVASAPETECNKGLIYVLMGSGGSTYWWKNTSGILGTAACDDYFGTALAVGDFNDDGYDDLAVGAPGASDSGYAASGSVHVIYGSTSGLTATGDQIWHQDISGIEGVAAGGDLFGSALSAGDFNCDGYSDLAVGTPGETVTAGFPPVTAAGAGAVNVIYGSATGLSTLDSIWYQGTGGVDGSPESNDYFGSAVAAGNFNGDISGGHECFDLAIGAPNEDQSSTVTDSGYVYIIDRAATGLSSTGDQGIDQDVASVADTTEDDDQLALRLEVRELDNDIYDDLMATVPGDGCSTSAGWGRHVFHGSSGGLSFSNDVINCDMFDCQISEGEYTCLEPWRAVHASSGDDAVRLFFGADVAMGWEGNDSLTSSLGPDVLIGGAGADVLDGGKDADILLGGLGSDAFFLDLDCKIDADDVVDGGPGNDTVYSHKNEAQLLSAGVLLTSIEYYVNVSQVTDPIKSAYACEGFPIEGGQTKATDLTLTWDQLPNANTVYTTTTGILTLEVVNETAVTRVFTVRYILAAGGSRLVIEEETPTTLTARDDTTFTLDLSDFIPGEIDPELLDPAIFFRSASASLTAVAEIVEDERVVEHVYAPTLYGHAHDEETLKIYRVGARDSVYYGGDLAGLAAGGTGNSPFSRRIEAWGVVP